MLFFVFFKSTFQSVQGCCSASMYSYPAAQGPVAMERRGGHGVRSRVGAPPSQASRARLARSASPPSGLLGREGAWGACARVQRFGSFSVILLILHSTYSNNWHGVMRFFQIRHHFFYSFSVIFSHSSRCRTPQPQVLRG